MEDNNQTNNQSTNGQNQSAPYLSKRTQYNPNLKQMQQHTTTAHYQAPPVHSSTNNEGLPNFSAQQHSQPNPYTQGVPGQQGQVLQPPVAKHSGLGIASFIISIVTIIIGVISIISLVSGVFGIVNNAGADLEALSDPDQVNSMLLEGNLGAGTTSLIVGTFMLLLSMGISFIGGVLGLIAVFQANRKKVFSVLGLVLNGLVFIGFIFLFVIGLLAG